MSKTVYRGGEGEIIEKKSRFIATVQPVGTEEEAVEFISAIKKKYWDARHNCSAFVIGNRQELTRSSDDGEPSGTAGRPMLDLILKEGITNVAVVVTRYFGGILLGTGGLVRAYQQAVAEGLQHCVVIEKLPAEVLSVVTDYAGLGKLQYLFAKEEVPMLQVDYAEAVCLHAVVALDKKERLCKAVTEITSGAATVEVERTCEFAMIDGEPQLF